MSSINREREAYKNLLFAILEETFDPEEEFTLREVYVEADELLFQAEEYGLDEPDVGIEAIIRLAMKQLRNDGLIEGCGTYGWPNKTIGSPPSSPPTDDPECDHECDEKPLESTWSNQAVQGGDDEKMFRKVVFNEAVEERIYKVDRKMRPHKSWKKQPIALQTTN